MGAFAASSSLRSVRLQPITAADNGCCRQASRLPAAFDRAWEQMGGGPPDLVFPEEWLGVWEVQSTLTNVQIPLGPDFLPDPKARPPGSFSRLPPGCTTEWDPFRQCSKPARQLTLLPSVLP